jgi:predicted amidohydrolase
VESGGHNTDLSRPLLRSKYCVPRLDGQIIAQAPGDAEEFVIARCDLEKIDFTRRHWPFLRDRRIDAYGGLLQRFLK